jgi:hypothetical protein
MSRPAPEFIAGLIEAVGREHVFDKPPALEAYAADALGIGHSPDVVVIPGTVEEVATIARLCDAQRVPLVVRGAGTGYTGGAVPTAGGVVLSMERFNRIVEIDELNLLAIVEPNVITGDLQRAVERVGLFLSTRSREPRTLVAWRQRRRVRRWTARVQVRHYEAIRPGARSRVADRRDHPQRLEGREERRRLRPHAGARGIGGHAGDHHEDHPASGPAATRARDADGCVWRESMTRFTR